MNDAAAAGLLVACHILSPSVASYNCGVEGEDKQRVYNGC